MLPIREQAEISQFGRFCDDKDNESRDYVSACNRSSSLSQTLHPDVQNSTVRHEGHDTMRFSKEQQMLAQELAVQMKVQKDGTCPIEWMFLSLLDSHEKTGHAERYNRLI